MILNATRSPRSSVVTVGGIMFVITTMVFLHNHFDSWDLPSRPLSADSVLPNSSSDLLDFYVRHLQGPSIKPSTKSYKPYGAFDTVLPDGDPIHTKSMGKKLCIIDLDNRKFDEAGQIFGPKLMSWDHADEIHGLSLGVLNHWLYAKIHGYQYYFVEIDTPEDRRASWKKPPVMSKILKNHDTCLYLDSDAIFEHLDLPFEWLLNYWQLRADNNSLAFAVDPDENHNKDKFGKLYLNTGFIIAQNNPKTYEIMDAWQSCPDEGGIHPECTKFRKNAPGQPTDQGGFGTYIRYDFPEHIKELPCTEANGFPQSGSNCAGKFIRHLWTGKDSHIKVAVGQQLPGDYLAMFHKQYLEDRSSFFITEEQLMKKERV